MARVKNLTSDVIFLGKQNQVQDLLHCGDVLLLPSDIESFGLAALEGMASGVPAICSRVGGVPEVIHDGVEGFLVEPRDVQTMAARAIEILSDPELQAEMSK